MVNGYAGLSERKFRKWVQMDANTPLCHSERPLCHSEHSEESREGKGKEIHRSALNDKLVVNGYAWYTVSERRGTSPQPPPLQRGEEISITFLLFFSSATVAVCGL